MSATGNPRNKVALKPGHSLMDWIRLGNNEDLAGTGGAILQVTKEELAKHHTEKDAWLCIRGNVYNITRYLDFHPGGAEELMKGAGIEATNLFNKVHPWVNFESILKKCFVGRLSLGIDENTFALPGPSKSNSKLFNNVLGTNIPRSIPSDDIRLDWYQQDTFITMVIYLKEFTKKLELSNEEIGELKVTINDLCLSWLLPHSIIWPPLLTVTDSKVEAKFSKEKAMAWDKMPTKSENEYKPSNSFQQMVMKQVEKVNHNVFHISLSYTDRVLSYVPMGYHVPLKTTINGVSVERNYTPICGLLEKLPNDVNLLVKSYAGGALSPWLTSRKVGDTVMVGSPVGTFTTSNISRASHLVLIAAGTGFTPMTRLIDWALGRRNKVLEVKLIFFNKKEKDIIWKSDMEKLRLSNRRFIFENILSEGDLTWKDARGYMTPQLLHGLIPDFSKDEPFRYFICVCGPIAFTQLADRYLQDMGYSEENYFCF